MKINYISRCPWCGCNSRMIKKENTYLCSKCHKHSITIRDNYVFEFQNNQGIILGLVLTLTNTIINNIFKINLPLDLIVVISFMMSIGILICYSKYTLNNNFKYIRTYIYDEEIAEKSINIKIKNAIHLLKYSKYLSNNSIIPICFTDENNIPVSLVCCVRIEKHKFDIFHNEYICELRFLSYGLYPKKITKHINIFCNNQIITQAELI